MKLRSRQEAGNSGGRAGVLGWPVYSALAWIADCWPMPTAPAWPYTASPLGVPGRANCRLLSTAWHQRALDDLLLMDKPERQDGVCELSRPCKA